MQAKSTEKQNSLNYIDLNRRGIVIQCRAFILKYDVKTVKEEKNLYLMLNC